MLRPEWAAEQHETIYAQLGFTLTYYPAENLVRAEVRPNRGMELSLSPPPNLGAGLVASGRRPRSRGAA
jgi:hypothetical protein